ncbi:hypothetical protein KSP39_PZI023460 [Platanthera zijinensis]|uniref:Uncharacterized protein n=1 Tax=Platanthera zijinensis TaxID=2320716 RepID=A0AAP0FUA3_9ASPA
MRSVFVMDDHTFADSRYLDYSSGTTVLAALIFGRGRRAELDAFQHRRTEIDDIDVSSDSLCSPNRRAEIDVLSN